MFGYHIGCFRSCNWRFNCWQVYILLKYSLEIYVLHWLFLPRMQDWGKYLLGQASFNENLILTAMVCSFVSAFIIAFCMIVAKVVKQSSILDYLYFGDKKKNN